MTRSSFAAAPALLALLFAAGSAQAAPDLVVEALSVSPTGGPNGTTVAITATIRNQGASEAAASVTRIRINQSSSSVGPSDDPICSSVPTPVLAAGASAEVGCSPRLSGRPGGANYIWAIADVNKDIGQVETANDRRSVLFTVDAAASDLVVDDVVLDPADVANGDDLTVTVTIRNQGTGPSLASTTRIRLNQDPLVLSPTDPTFCNIPTPAVATGKSIEVECSKVVSGLAPGTQYVWVIADVNKVAGQIDTTNDRAHTALEVSDLASDLVVDSVVVDPPSAPATERVNVTVAIRNQGTQTASSSVTRIRINQNPDAVGGADPQICDDLPTSQISVGQTKTLTCKATLGVRPAGLNYIWAIADAGGSAGQADRSNDRAKSEFLVEPGPAPDLVVRSLTLNPTSGLGDKQVTVTARIANDGAGPAAASMTRILINTDPAAIAEGDTVLCDQIPTATLSAGASVQVSCQPTILGQSVRPYGINRVWAVADATATSLQTNTANDTLSAAYEVLSPPAPDLVVESFTAAPASADPGTQVSITARIRNQGTSAAAASATTIRINDSATVPGDLDPVVCAAVATPALAAGAATDVACNWTVAGRPPGPAFLWATADSGSTAGQLNRANDVRSTPFTVLVPDGPNLTLKRLTVLPASARNGATIVIKARVLNKGNRRAAASVTTFRINEDASGVGDGDQVLCESVATKSLAVGDVARIRCTAVVADQPIGPHSIWATVDTTHTAVDVDARDDNKRTAFTVVDVLCSDVDAPRLEWPLEQPRVLEDYASYGSVPLAGGKLGYHSGIELVSQLPIAPGQTPVYAAADGEVVAERHDCPSPASEAVNPPDGRCAGGWGNYVVLRHGGEIFSVYAHLGSVFVTKGCVEAGQRLALVGSSGSSGIPVQLHFDVMADLVEPVARASLGSEHYRRYHPMAGHVPENDDGDVQVHLDPRGFMERSRVRITVATSASRGVPVGGAAAFVSPGQEYVSYGELVPGFVCIDLPFAVRPEDGPPYTDDSRYGWVPLAKVEILETSAKPGSVSIDGYKLFLQEGAGSNFVALRDSASETSAEISKAWGGQQLVPSGAPVAQPGSGRLWQAVDVPGLAATGASAPREAWVPVDRLTAD